MVAVSGSIPNLIGGVSQQPPEIRPINTLNDLLNGTSSVVSGVGKRPALQHLFDLGAHTGDSLAATTFDRSDGYRVISYVDGDFRIYNILTGALETVTVVGDAGDYLDTDDINENIRFLTVGDTVFVYNRTVEVEADAIAETGDRLDPELYETVWIKQYIRQHYYTIYINGDLAAQVKPTATDYYGSDGVAWRLKQALDALDPMPLESAEITGSTLHMEKTLAADEYVVWDGYGDQAHVHYGATISAFTDLAPEDAEGRMVQVTGDLDDSADGYYVVFREGTWYEETGYGHKEELDATTMPHALVYNGDGTWTFDVHEWTERLAGDDVSNPSPSFVGNTVNRLFRLNGRLAILSDENIITSEKNVYENFYRTTTTQLLDSDRIDIAADTGAERSVSTLNHYATNNDDILLFSEDIQYTLSYTDGILGPNTVDLVPTTHYQCSPRCPPAYIHNNIVFADDHENSKYVTLREYRVNEVSAVNVGEPITAHVPEYIPSGLYHLVATNANNKVLGLTTGDRSAAYLYEYFYNSEGKSQSAWSKWQFAGCTLYWTDFIGTSAYFMYHMNGRVYLGKVALEETLTSSFTAEGVLLDHLVDSEDLTVSYNSGTAITTVTLPYILDDEADQPVAVTSPSEGGDAAGEVLEPDTINVSGTNTLLTFDDRDLIDTDFTVGCRYSFELFFSRIYRRDENQVPIQEGRLQLSSVSLLVNNTSYFTLEVTPPGRDTFTNVFSGRRLGSSTSELGALALVNDSYRVGVRGESTGTDIKLISDSPFPVRVSSMEWRGGYRPGSKRIS